MQLPTLHRWDVDPTDALELQRALALRVDVTARLERWTTVAAADVAYETTSDLLYAAVVVVRADTLEVIERASAVGKVRFPYVPGLFSFRETPPILEAFEKLQVRPDVVMCDGQGIAHPRRLGLASHLGLWLELPTIGCAKSCLCGTHDEPGSNRGDRAPLVDGSEVIGAVVRTCDRVRPVYVSPGHLCDLDGAVDLVLATSGKYRIPEPARLADSYVNALRRAGAR